jgi:hypothetical protein
MEWILPIISKMEVILPHLDFRLAASRTVKKGKKTVVWTKQNGLNIRILELTL